MKIGLTTATIALASVSGLAQSARTGVSNPEPVVITAQPDETVTVKVRPAKPSAAVPASSAVSRDGGARTGEVYGPYVPYRGAGAAEAVGASLTDRDADGAIVTSVEEHPGEVREGTLLRARIKQGLSTVSTAPGSKFTAELAEAVEKDGRVVLPVGALLEGRVTEVHGGRRISGAATLHLEPRSVTLPDGTHYEIHAQLIDTDQGAHAKIDREGTLVRRDHPKETLAVVGGTTGAAAVAGGMLGGGVGAGVGALVGVSAGTIVWLKQDRQATLPENSLLVFSLREPMPLMPVGATPISRAETTTPTRRALPSGAGGIVE